MKGEVFVMEINDIDDALIMASMPGSAHVKTIIRNRRILKAAVFAACMILAAGTVAYASGVISSPFHIYKTSEELSSPDKMTDYADEYKDNGNGADENDETSQKNTGTINLVLFTGSVDVGELEGPIKEDALQTIAKQYNESYSPYPPYTGYNQFGKWFDSQKEALEYIGCASLEEQFFPFEDCEVAVVATGYFYWEGMPYNLPEKPDGFKLLNVNLYVRGEHDNINVELNTLVLYGKDGMPGNIGYFGVDTSSTSVQLFTTESGYNVSKMSPFEGQSTNYNITGTLSKNKMIYTIRILSDWDKKFEADKIFDDWVSNF